METKRNKQWRKEQSFRVFKKRMILFASYGGCHIMDDGQRVYYPHWFELAKCRWARVYKTTGTPCSCIYCKGERYDRVVFKKETRRIIRDLHKDNN